MRAVSDSETTCRTISAAPHQFMDAPGGLVFGGHDLVHPAGLDRLPSRGTPAAVLRDRSADVRRSATTALGEIGDLHALEALTGALGDKDAGVRLNATTALVQLDDPRAVKAWGPETGSPPESGNGGPIWDNAAP